MTPERARDNPSEILAPPRPQNIPGTTIPKYMRLDGHKNVPGTTLPKEYKRLDGHKNVPGTTLPK